MAEKTTILKPEFVYYMPEVKERDILYLSEEFSLAIHMCVCGCDIQTVMNLANWGKIPWKDGWNIIFNGDLVSFAPSILNSRCGAHYFIENNEVKLC